MSSAATKASVDVARIFGPRGEGFLPCCLEALKQSLPVEEVWLFGSCARGEAKPDSDLDLLVVLADDHGLARPNLACFRVVNHLPDTPPADVLAITKSRWEQERTHPFGLFGDVAQQGICLYAK